MLKFFDYSFNPRVHKPPSNNNNINYNGSVVDKLSAESEPEHQSDNEFDTYDNAVGDDGSVDAVNGGESDATVSEAAKGSEVCNEATQLCRSTHFPQPVRQWWMVNTVKHSIKVE